MKPAPAEDPTDAVVRRITAILTTADLDCACRTRLASALDRFAKLEHERHRRRDLHEARRQRQRIASLIALLAELDEISSDEADAGVYCEMALLFDDVAGCAALGAHAMRALTPEAD